LRIKRISRKLSAIDAAEIQGVVGIDKLATGTAFHKSRFRVWSSSLTLKLPEQTAARRGLLILAAFG
jgi:hypothetical protein